MADFLESEEENFKTLEIKDLNLHAGTLHPNDIITLSHSYDRKAFSTLKRVKT